MDVFNVILLLVILILIITNNSGTNKKLYELEFMLSELQKLIKKRDQQNSTKETVNEEVAKPIPVPQPVEVKLPEPPKPPEIRPEPVIERHEEVIADNIPLIKQPIKTVPPPIKTWTPPPVKTNEPPRPSFFERNPDLEKFIGENLVNKIGIAILVLAIGFFVKYAIENNWIGPIGRVGIGILCGGILIAFAHRLRNSYNAFSSVLAGGGLAVFYFTITLAYQEFHLFSQLVALSIMVVITLFAVALALLYDKQELAIIALIGGFASPFLTSDGRANYDGLFIYLLVLNVGLLVIAYFKAWRLLNILAFAFSTIILAAVLYDLPLSGYYIGLRYATIFYLLFFTINIINNIRENKQFLGIDFSILLINTALYFGAGLYLLTAMHLDQFRGLFSAALAALNLVLSFILFRNKKADPNVLYLLIGITLTFISLTAPIQLHGNNITMFWASETVLLYWLYQKSSIKLMKLTSLLIWLAMLMSLFMDLTAVYMSPALHLTIIANKGFVTTIVVAVSSYLLYVLMKKEESTEIYGFGVNKNLYKITAFILLFLSGVFEINHQFDYYYPNSGLNILYLMLYLPVFVYLFNVVSAKINRDSYNWQLAQTFGAFTVILYLLSSSTTFDLLQTMLEKHTIVTAHLAAHGISDIFIGSLIYQLINICKNHLEKEMQGTASWIISASIVIFLSLEFGLLSNLLFYSKTNSITVIETVYVKTALPVLWGLISFILMWMGMRNKQRSLRIISLSLFLLTLIKLFLFDIVDIPVAGKIAAFFCLGVLLLIISFMYQKVKKIITEDEVKPEE